MSQSLVIVGASYAGAQLAASAREQGFTGSIVLLGEEPHAPYQRPPLSKGFLTGKTEEASLPLRAPAFYEEQRIELKTSARVSAINRDSREISLSNGEGLRYDVLGLTTGARCRLLNCDGAGREGVHYLRSLDDARAIAHTASQATRVVVIGGGFIGLEAAASMRTLGKVVTVVEAQDRLLPRVTPGLLGQYLHDMHASHGVQLILGSQVKRIGGGARVEFVELANGQMLPCDLVLAGIGVVPNTELAEACGLTVANGIVVDEYARSSDPAIVAAGDCASYPNPWAHTDGHRIRLESVQSANDLARIAGSTAAGQLKAYNAVPWFWSEQYDMRLQMAGISIGWDRLVLRGKFESNRFSVFYFKGDKLIGVDSVNHAMEHMQARKLLAAHVPVSDAQASDVEFDFKTLLPGTRP